MSEEKPVRVAIVDDQTIFRRGMASFVIAIKEFQLVGEARNGEEAIQLCELLEPDVVFMDLKMPHMDGISATNIIRERWPRIRVIGMVNTHEEYLIQGALEAGAADFILKDISDEAFTQALLHIHQNCLPSVHKTSFGLIQRQHLQILAEELRITPVGSSSLPELFGQHLPRIFPNAHIRVRIFPDQDLFVYPSHDAYPLAEVTWRWLHTIPDPKLFLPGDDTPWGQRNGPDNYLVIVPILRIENRQPIGGMCIHMAQAPENFEESVPVLQSLAMHIANAIDISGSRLGALTTDAIARELIMAGKIQADILPDRTPTISGWELAARLESARETSGDFYDFIPLANNNWGIVIADVTDKGMGAALFMALSSTLIRTYATHYPSLPAFTMGLVNERILSDTRGNMFVTTFFGVLEPSTARMRYVNAGHPPPILISTQKGKPVDRLSATGMALGVMDNASWQQKIVRFSLGDVLLFYTDGITEAQNQQGYYFGEQRLMDIVKSRAGSPAKEILDAVMVELHRFLGDTPPQDDIALIVMCKTT